MFGDKRYLRSFRWGAHELWEDLSRQIDSRYVECNFPLIIFLRSTKSKGPVHSLDFRTLNYIRENTAFGLRRCPTMSTPNYGREQYGWRPTVRRDSSKL
jgi:hypothetical protein